MKTKSPRRPLTGAALKAKLKEHDANVVAIKQADALVDAVKHHIYSKERILVSDLPGDLLVMQFAFRKLVDYILYNKETEGYELKTEKELRIKLATKHSLEMAEATAGINAFKAALAVLLK